MDYLNFKTNKQKTPRTAGGIMTASNSEDQKIKMCL